MCNHAVPEQVSKWPTMRFQVQLLVSILMIIDFSAAIMTRDGTFLRKFDQSCTSLLWLVGFQTKAEGGGEVFYLADSSDYVDHLKVAIISAQRNAPSLVPIIVFTGSMRGNAPLVAWIEQHGGYALHHSLTFVNDLKRLSSDPKYSYSQNLWGSWLRVDIVAIMSRVEKMMGDLALLGHKVPRYDTQHILWTDPDVIFEQPIDSCTLPEPYILSVGPEVGMGTANNYGVIYFNLAGYSAMLPDMLKWAKEKSYHFEHDQDLMVQYIGNRVNSLPDSFNWKIYWGNTTMARGPHYPGGNITILHFHGPKLKLAMCFFEKLKVFKQPTAVSQQEQLGLIRMCGLKTPRESAGEGEFGHLSTPYVALLAHILFNAYKVDKGDFYSVVQTKFSAFQDLV